MKRKEKVKSKDPLEARTARPRLDLILEQHCNTTVVVRVIVAELDSCARYGVSTFFFFSFVAETAKAADLAIVVPIVERHSTVLDKFEGQQS